MLFSPVLVLMTCASWSYAAPALIDQRDIGVGLFSEFELMEQYAAAAYCPTNNNSPGTQLSCHVGNCPLVDAANTTTTSEFENLHLADTTGYVATDYTNNLIVVAFRGSTSILNWIRNLDFFLKSTTLCSSCDAHRGFWDSWTEAKDSVLQAVTSAVAANPGFKVVCTGHSLGGAIASLAAADLRNAGHIVALYTFGAPRFGNSALSNHITNQAGGNYRITHLSDPIPQLPPNWLGFDHISPEYYISVWNFLPVTSAGIKMCSGSLDSGCNAGWIFRDLVAHGWYFNHIWLCFPIDWSIA